MCTSERREVIVTGDEKGAPLGPPPPTASGKRGSEGVGTLPYFHLPLLISFPTNSSAERARRVKGEEARDAQRNPEATSAPRSTNGEATPSNRQGASGGRKQNESGEHEEEDEGRRTEIRRKTKRAKRGPWDSVKNY